jgi:hypothetical protein
VIRSWAATTDLESLISWTPPNDYEFSLLTRTQSPTDEVQEWLVERFTKTYPETWVESSRELEYKYLMGEQISPCNTSDMQTRRIGKAELCEAIADSHIRGTDRASEGALSADRYVETAVGMLKSGRRAAAAAVFEAQRIVAPSDATAHNNYGFCLLMDDPTRALEALEQAAEMDFPWWDINVANRMLAMTRLERSTSALELATQFWPNRNEKRRSKVAHLWAFEPLQPGADPVLLSDIDTHVYIAGLAAEIARSAGDDHLSDVWSDRAAQASDELTAR